MRSMAGCPHLCLTAECSAVDPLTPALAGQTQLAPTRKTTHHANSTIAHVHLSLFHSRVFVFQLCVCVIIAFTLFVLTSKCWRADMQSSSALLHREATFVPLPLAKGDYFSPKGQRGRRTCVGVCMFVSPSDINCKCGFIFSLFVFSLDTHLYMCCWTNLTMWTLPLMWKTTEWRRLIPLFCSRHPILSSFFIPRSLHLFSTELALLLTVSLCSCRVIYI